MAGRRARDGKQRRADQVKPGWWVYSVDARGGCWGRVVTTTQYLDGRGRRMVRLVVDDPTAPGVEIDSVSDYPAWCATPAEARTAGLTLNPEGT